MFTQIFEQLRDSLFSDESKYLQLEKGVVLLEKDQINHRLFLVKEGRLAGYTLKDDGSRDKKLFEAGPGSFVGVYSYFQRPHRSYSTVIAREPSIVAWIDDAPMVLGEKNKLYLSDFFIPLLASEVQVRQEVLTKASAEREAALQRLAHAEKMATLGQMAAGLAHELNNAVGVLERKTEWMLDIVSAYLRENDRHGMYRFFEMGLDRGQYLSSSEVRQKRQELEEKFGFDPRIAKKLSRIGLSEEQIQKERKTIKKHGRELIQYWEMGANFHDMQVAAQHSTHVVGSVKHLGVSDHQMEPGVRVDSTIHQALAILRSMLKSVQVEIDIEEMPPILASPGELVQIWVNLIKNAVEALENAATGNPTIRLTGKVDKDQILVTIADNGPGIPKEMEERIFEPSFTTRQRGLSFGLGLGLAIVQRLVANHQGEVRVNTRPGQTVFTIRLPIRSA